MKKLVLYFSASAGKVTEGVAKKLAAAIDADLFEIEPEKVYTEADIKWTNPMSRCNREKLGKKEVPFKRGIDNMAEYDTIYIGFPIWYGIAPNAVGTFVKAHDFSGKKIVVFATSGGSKMGRTSAKLQEQLGGGKVVAEKLLSADVTEEELKNWAVF